MSTSSITKNALAIALKKLMEEKDFDQISVSDICNACNLNRKSFYYHFKDKYDLINWIFYTDFFESIELNEYEDGWEFFETICTYLYSERDFYKCAFKIEGQNSFKDYFFETLHPIMIFFAGECFEESEIEFAISVIYDSFVVSLMRWLSSDVETTPAGFVGSLKKILVILSGKMKP